MRTPLTQKILDSMRCQTPDCDHASTSGPMFLHPICHPDEGTWCSYEASVLEIRCRSCKKLVAQVAVDPGDVTRH